MQVAGDKRYEKLLAAYQRYDQAIARAKDEPHARDYVAACICFQKTEHANRFILAARLAEYMISHGMDAETLFSQRSTAILGRNIRVRIIDSTGRESLWSTLFIIIQFIQKMICNLHLSEHRQKVSVQKTKR